MIRQLTTTPFALTLGALALAACGEAADPAAATRVESRDISTCTADFDVTITDGPEAGLAKRGKLRLAQLGESLTGVLESETETINVSGSLNDQIVLTFHLADGRNIIGMGPAPAQPCSGRIEGVAVGPSLDASAAVSAPATSSGHWIATELTPDQVAVSLNYEGGTLQSVDGFPQNTIVSMDCINSNGGRQQTQCSDGVCSGTGLRASIACFIERTFSISCASAQANCENAGGMFVSPETPNQS